VVQEIRNITLPRRLVATYDDAQFYCLQSTNVINLREVRSDWDIKYLLGLLNSNCANFFFRQRYAGNNHIASNQLASIPVPAASPAQQERVALLVDKALSLHKRLSQARIDQEKTVLQRQINAADHQIERLIYALFRLNAEEIALIEGSDFNSE
jgi:adenine-specific DNA-methyltransferase